MLTTPTHSLQNTKTTAQFDPQGAQLKSLTPKSDTYISSQFPHIDTIEQLWFTPESSLFHPTDAASRAVPEEIQNTLHHANQLSADTLSYDGIIKGLREYKSNRVYQTYNNITVVKKYTLLQDIFYSNKEVTKSEVKVDLAVTTEGNSLDHVKLAPSVVIPLAAALPENTTGQVIIPMSLMKQTFFKFGSVDESAITKENQKLTMKLNPSDANFKIWIPTDAVRKAANKFFMGLLLTNTNGFSTFISLSTSDLPTSMADFFDATEKDEWGPFQIEHYSGPHARTEIKLVLRPLKGNFPSTYRGNYTYFISTHFGQTEKVNDVVNQMLKL